MGLDERPDSLDERLMPSKPFIPPKCRECGEKWEKIQLFDENEKEKQSKVSHEVYEPVCDCYRKDIRLSVG